MFGADDFAFIPEIFQRYVRKLIGEEIKSYLQFILSFISYIWFQSTNQYVFNHNLNINPSIKVM